MINRTCLFQFSWISFFSEIYSGKFFCDGSHMPVESTKISVLCSWKNSLMELKWNHMISAIYRKSISCVLFEIYKPFGIMHKKRPKATKSKECNKKAIQIVVSLNFCWLVEYECELCFWLVFIDVYAVC